MLLIVSKKNSEGLMRYQKENGLLKKEGILKSLNPPILHHYEFDVVKSVPKDATPQCCKICGVVHIAFSERLK